MQFLGSTGVFLDWCKGLQAFHRLQVALFRLSVALSVLHPLGLDSLPTFSNSKRGYFRGFLGLGGASVPSRALHGSTGLKMGFIWVFVRA